MWNERSEIAAMELKMWNLSFESNVVSQKLIPHSFVPHFNVLLKVVLKNFKRMPLVHRFDEFFRF